VQAREKRWPALADLVWELDRSEKSEGECLMKPDLGLDQGRRETIGQITRASAVPEGTEKGPVRGHN